MNNEEFPGVTGDDDPRMSEGCAIHQTAQIHASARIDAYSVISENAHIGAGVRLGYGVYVGSGSAVMAHCKVGDHVHIDANSVIPIGSVVANRSAISGLYSHRGPTFSEWRAAFDLATAELKESARLLKSEHAALRATLKACWEKTRDFDKAEAGELLPTILDAHKALDEAAKITGREHYADNFGAHVSTEISAALS